MFKSKLFFFVLIILLSLNLEAQNKLNPLTMGIAPRIMNPLPPSVIQPASPLAWNTNAFGYNAYGSVIPVGPFKFFLNAPSVLTSLAADSLSSNFIQAGSFDANGIWWGVRYGTNTLVKIDTSSGIITQVVSITGATTVTGLAWNFSSGVMYASDYNSGTNRIGTINLTTGVFTPLIQIFATGILIDIACSNDGSIYGHMITGTGTQSQIYKNGILLGNTGFIGSYAQGMSWDHRVDSGYLAAYNNTTSTGELRRINTTTGATTLIGSFGCEVDGFAIPGAPGPLFSNFQIQNTQSPCGPYLVTTQILPGPATVTSAKFYWARNVSTMTDSINMTKGAGTNWSCSFPGNGLPGTYNYCMQAVDQVGFVTKMPPGAPTSFYSFTVSASDTTKPVITHTPIQNYPRINWPATVSCIATEPCGMDTVWVSWNINSDSYNMFYLTRGSSNRWIGMFNSDTSQVVPGDLIHYRIIARSSSAQHSMDSTSLYSFNIISSQHYVCIGDGNLSSIYPFTTYWDDGKTDLVFCSDEILAAGGYLGFIEKIGFNVISADTIQLNGFQIKMLNSTDCGQVGVNPWTVCYSGTYKVPGSGWQYINLTTPFFWTPGQNLFVEICYNNAAWSQYSPVYATAQTSKMNGYCTDLPTGDGCTANWNLTSLAYRSNTCFFIDPGDKVKNKTGIIPSVYSLSQNYPNPFNPITKIDFSIPKNGFVVLKIYDVLGREIKTLVNENKTAGYYTIDFNASEFSSGVYFYRLESNGYVNVKRMMLIK